MRYLPVPSLFRHSSPRRAASRESASSGMLPTISCHIGFATGWTFFSRRSRRAVNSASFCSIASALMLLLCQPPPLFASVLETQFLFGSHLGVRPWYWHISDLEDPDQ